MRTIVQRWFCCVLPVFLAGSPRSLAQTTQPSTAPALDLDLTQTIVLDPGGPGRVFEGIGALSAGASSRLLIDYPEPQRSEILDFLFRPNRGAALHHLKVEIGGNVNSTDGSEPSHAHVRSEFEQPEREYYERGYEWWLMTEARRRNAGILLESLQWGAPGWIGGGNFFSQDNAEFIAAFHRGARDYQNLRINYQGLWNEHQEYRVDWIKLLRRTLDKYGLQHVGIVAFDGVGGNPWSVLNDMVRDAELARIVYAVNPHYPGYTSPPAAQASGSKLWSGEDGPWRGDWEGARSLARIYNRNYIVGRMTKTIIWSPVSAYCDNLPLPGSGLMKANTPWSGHYEVQPAIWITAHTTQFTQPGWRYMDRACGLLSPGGSCVALVSPNNGQYSVIIETMDAPYSDRYNFVNHRRVQFRIGVGLPAGPVHVWRSTAVEQFVQLPDIVPLNGAFAMDIEGHAVYTLTTTTGQKKGKTEVPAAMPFPIPYRDDFEAYSLDKLPRYFSDQNGTFAVAAGAARHSRVLRQLALERGIEWVVPMDQPWTLIGDSDWKDYQVSADVLIERSGCAAVYARVGSDSPASPAGRVPPGYGLKIGVTGRWDLLESDAILESGTVAIVAGEWHTLQLCCVGQVVIASIDGRVVASISDDVGTHGMAALGCSFDHVQFDNVAIVPIAAPPTTAPTPLVNLATGKPARASSEWGSEYAAAMANDGNGQTRWNAGDNTAGQQWIEIDLGTETTFDRSVCRPLAGRITRYRIQYWDGRQWKDAAIRERIASARCIDNFIAVTSRKVRLFIDATSGPSASVWEFGVYRRSP